MVAGGGGAGSGGGGGGGVLRGVVTMKQGERWKVRVGNGGGAGQGHQMKLFDVFFWSDSLMFF